MPAPPACAVSLQSCTACPPPPTPALDFIAAAGHAGFGSQACVWACAAGYFYLNAGCVICPAGTYKGWAGNDTQCTSCSEGTFSPNAGATQCTSCPPFSIAVGGGATSCQCLSGYYFLLQACTVCSPGYVSSLGATLCTQCTPGTVWVGV